MSRFPNRFRTSLALLAGTIIVLSLQSGSAVAKEATKSAFVSEMIGQLDRAKGQIISLEGAIPQDKFTWRPAEGVRSISEVYLHIADANYLFMSFAGAKPPMDMKQMMDQKMREGATTDKAKIAVSLNASFDWTKNALSALTDADLEKQINMFGTKTTVRNALLTMLGHLHEHLGQSIAYARSNGVVPPWTEAQQEQMKKSPKK
jgi:uncharacterized damage-inducible protein DinB